MVGMFASLSIYICLLCRILSISLTCRGPRPHSDVILGLIDRKHHANYFPGSKKQKLSGSLAQAAAYGLPIVLHEDLEPVYIEQLKSVHTESHSDDPASFQQALDRMTVWLEESRQD